MAVVRGTAGRGVGGYPPPRYGCVVRYWPNPVHKRGTTEAGPPAWRPSKEPCPDHLRVEEREALLVAAVSSDPDDSRSRRYKVRREGGRLELFEAKWHRDVDGDPEFHGHPTTRVPSRVLRALRDSGRLSPAEYRRLVKELG